MSFTFRPGVRENVGLWINLIGGTGGGKTFTAMRLASGISAGKSFAVIDTENRRALHYADQFKFDHADLREPFTPASYAEAILAADQAGYPAIVVDSGTHVWAGDGGMLDMQEAELDRMAGDDWKKREAVKMSSWIKPKRQHKKMVSKLLQLNAHLILCLRAEEKIEMVKQDGRMVVRAKQSLTGKDGWIPVCDKNLPFEATCSFLLLASVPGIPHPIKLQEQHKALFPLDQPINEESGKRLAEWACGGAAPSKSTSLLPSGTSAAAGSPIKTRTDTLTELCTRAGVTLPGLLAKAGVQHADEMSDGDYAEALAMLRRRAAKRELAEQA